MNFSRECQDNLKVTHTDSSKELYDSDSSRDLYDSSKDLYDRSKNLRIATGTFAQEGINWTCLL